MSKLPNCCQCLSHYQDEEEEEEEVEYIADEDFEESDLSDFEVSGSQYISKQHLNQSSIVCVNVSCILLIFFAEAEVF